MNTFKPTSLALLLILALSACSQQEPPIKEDLAKHGLRDANLIDLDEAVRIASAHYSAVFGETRTSQSPRLKGFEILEKKQTRSENAGLYGYYILNFENDGGFAIVSADRRREELYAISDEGSLHLSDTLENPGLNWYLNDYLVGGLGGMEPGNPTPSFPDSLDLRHDFLPVINIRYEPVIKSFLKHFSQNTPYNKYCPLIGSERAVVGCAPLAIGTIMGHYDWPLEYKGHPFDWFSMKINQFDDRWARLFEIAGRSENLATRYGVNESPSYSSLVPRTFSNMGYKGATLTNFSKYKVMDNLKEGRPVLVTGIPRDADTGHMWIIDGGYIKTYKVLTVEPDKVEYYHYYFHCIWGYAGKGNGFYLLMEDEMGGSGSELDYGSGIGDFYNMLCMIGGYTPNN